MKLSSKNRLMSMYRELFPGDTLFHRIARTLRAGVLSRKELYETWEMARRVRRRFRGDGWWTWLAAMSETWPFLGERLQQIDVRICLHDMLDLFVISGVMSPCPARSLKTGLAWYEIGPVCNWWQPSMK